MNWFAKLRESLSKTKNGFVDKVTRVFSRSRIDEDLWIELEETLLTADVGVATTDRLLAEMRKVTKERKLLGPEELFPIFREHVRGLFAERDRGLVESQAKPQVILIIGVNGSGKTTSIAKLAYYLKKKGDKVLLAAADTFRAAAGDQLEIWAHRVGAELVRHKEGADPAAVVFDALAASRARGMDVLIIDTAGRLHTKTNLMEELKKVCRIIKREIPDAPHEVLLVLDATTGQNALSQATLFLSAVPVSGIVLSKLDGTAKGGAIISIEDSLKVPVKFIGMGETEDALRPFQPEDFVQALFEG
ncbi:MAG: signal recognition particle-docking protein FtsY [Armatimonadetes bacterium]|nr:signal recognition particle-docking protein FtsY [Armatimonadota bacterium]